jgi:hypothetical protein
MGYGIDKGVLKTFLLLLAVVGIVGAIYITIVIWLLIGGAMGQIATNGSIPVTNGTTAALNTAQTQFITNMGYVQTASGFAAGLLGLVALLIIFAAFVDIGKQKYDSWKKKKKEGPGNMEMGY